MLRHKYSAIEIFGQISQSSVKKHSFDILTSKMLIMKSRKHMLPVTMKEKKIQYYLRVDCEVSKSKKKTIGTNKYRTSSPTPNRLVVGVCLNIFNKTRGAWSIVRMDSYVIETKLNSTVNGISLGQPNKLSPNRRKSPSTKNHYDFIQSMQPVSDTIPNNVPSNNGNRK